MIIPMMYTFNCQFAYSNLSTQPETNNSICQFLILFTKVARSSSIQQLW